MRARFLYLSVATWYRRSTVQKHRVATEQSSAIRRHVAAAAAAADERIIYDELTRVV